MTGEIKIYCPFQKDCKYAKDLSHEDDFLSISIIKLYECRALEEKPEARCSYLENLNITKSILDKFRHL